MNYHSFGALNTLPLPPMKTLKRLEIITSSVERHRIEAIFNDLDLTGYTYIQDVAGMGRRGFHSGDELTDVFKNIIYIIACEEEKADQVTEAIRPILTEFGGICLINDVESLPH